MPVSDDQIGTNDDADVIDLQALTGMNAAHLLNRVLGDDPEAAILVEIPLAPVVLTNDDVVCSRVLLAAPGPAIAGYDTGLV
ncbi:hypothetical protein D3C78_1736850 [compost metagenome]